MTPLTKLKKLAELQGIMHDNFDCWGLFTDGCRDADLPALVAYVERLEEFAKNAKLTEELEAALTPSPDYVMVPSDCELLEAVKSDLKNGFTMHPTRSTPQEYHRDGATGYSSYKPVISKVNALLDASVFTA